MKKNSIGNPQKPSTAISNKANPVEKKANLDLLGDSRILKMVKKEAKYYPCPESTKEKSPSFLQRTIMVKPNLVE
ncbi:hypothetical protein [Algoriphagus litoralis]|uniref:hypothetical protein n=1 Tax=Algoriphagus litoralis TaxID=2202829 RepID=UPI0013007151|nr:hypothetical protein [Algoriphagus litoralis]